jgi:ABC-type dipeptide/oligopeptide/nickel transport system ATPase component
LVKRAELEAKIKEKILLMGDSGTGKTYTAVKVAKLVAESGEKVVFVDPEYGAERELELLSDDVLEDIELKITPRWEMLKVAIEHNDSCFLKVVDGLAEVFESVKHFLEQRYIARGEYIVGDKSISISDPQVFVLPWAGYPKVYSEVLASCRKLVEQKPHIICTTHSFGETPTQRKLTENVYRKFDTVLELKKQSAALPVPSVAYTAQCRKHRGTSLAGLALVKDHIGQLERLFKKRMGIKEESETVRVD